jgi:hypothetical protein
VQHSDANFGIGTLARVPIPVEERDHARHQETRGVYNCIA